MFNQDKLTQIYSAILNKFCNGSILVGYNKEVLADFDDNILYHDFFDKRNNIIKVGTLNEDPKIVIARLLLINQKYHLDLINNLDSRKMKECEKYEYVGRE